MNSIKDRMLDFLKYLNIGQSKFEKNTGLSNGLINNIGDNLTAKTINKISAIYPELNTGWLLTGEGQMLKQKVKSNTSNTISEGAESSQNIRNAAMLMVVLDAQAEILANQKNVTVSEVRSSLEEAVRKREVNLRAELTSL